MNRGIITSNGYILGDNFDILIKKGVIEETENGLTHQKWYALLKESGLYDPKAKINVADLFVLLKHAFDIELKTFKNIRFQTGYVFSADFENSIKHSDSSRAYSTSSVIYIDELLVSVVFEYVAVYYLWALNSEDPDVYGSCFQRALFLLDGCYRKGNLDDDDTKAGLIDMIHACGIPKAPLVISKLYWVALAFAMCHELAHIYLNHTEYAYDDKASNWAVEYEADKLGYEVILNFIANKYTQITSPFLEIFQPYAYTAPQILLLFYEDLFYVGQWLHGEYPGDSHPDFKSRIDKLLEVSESQCYTFSTEDGNTLLSAFWDISDLFREEFFLKLKNGKLEEIKRKGDNTTMSGKGYEEAYAFDKEMCKVVRQMARAELMSEEKAVGLWDIAFQIDIPNAPGDRNFIWAVGDKVYTTKFINIYYNQKNALEAIIDMGISSSLPADTSSAIRFLLTIIFRLYKITTIELSRDMVRILIECHRRNAYKTGIDENQLLSVTEADMDSLAMLEKIKCLNTINGIVYLNEKVLLGNLSNI